MCDCVYECMYACIYMCMHTCVYMCVCMYVLSYVSLGCAFQTLACKNLVNYLAILLKGKF